MSIFAALTIGLIGILWYYYHDRQKRLDADEGQHHLASLLVGAALGRDGVTKRDVSAQLARISRGGADRRVRLTHAVLMIRSEAAPDLYEKVLALSREFS